ncbi:MAG: ethylbenzene dehydrogenase-related protein [Thermodesulfobacteriota bacterium]
MNGFKYIYLLIVMALFVVRPDSTLASFVDWTGAESHRITLIYPGYTSYEFLVSDDHRLGKRNILQTKKNCRRCHLSKRGELDLKTDEIVSGKAKMKRSRKDFEDSPKPGKKGVLYANLQSAFDKDYIYIKLSWSSRGTGWLASGKKTASDRVSIQLNKDHEPFKRYGCFITCHTDVHSMPNSPSKEEVRADPYYSSKGRDEVHLYAYYTRNGGSGWNNMKSAEEITELTKEGALIDLWSMELKAGVAKVVDGWVLEDRRWEKNSDVDGTATWSSGGGGGTYTAVFKRRLKTSSDKDIQIAVGDTISFAVAIHDGNATERKHYVSFPMTIGLSGKGEIKAKKLK